MENNNRTSIASHKWPPQKKFQLAKITAFGKCRLAKRLPPSRPAEIESPNFNRMFLTTLPQETDQGFFEILTVRWENRLWRWTQVVKKGQNRYLCGKVIYFFLRPARELIFSLKYFPLSVLTGKYHPCPGRKTYVDKKVLKFTESRFFGYGVLIFFQKIAFFDLEYWR